MFRNKADSVASLTLVCVVFANAHLALADQSIDFDKLTLSQLESRLADSQVEEASLAPITLRSGVGNLGWESRKHSTADHEEWVSIKLDKECLIDQIVLVPSLSRDALGVIRSDGFPIEFSIRIGKMGDDVGHEVASFSETDALLPRIAPVVIAIAPTHGNWIRIDATKLGPRGLDGGFLFQLSEIMAFSGEENVALGCETSVSSALNNRVSRSTRAEALVDGFTPFLLTAAQGKGSKAFVGFFLTGPQVTLTFDLGKPRRVNQIFLHAADRRQNVPQIHHADYAMPNHFIAEGSNKADFSEAVELFEYRKRSIYDSGPILMSRFDAHECRFVRLTAIEAYKAPEAKDKYRCIGFAEIEIFEDSRNVAARTIPITDIEYVGAGKQGNLSSLTDGRNDFGPIIPTREWVTQLARRHDLTTQVSMIQSLVKKRYAAQSRNFRWALGLIGILMGAIVGTVLINRLLRTRETNRLKERFAADLHDEVGADLHAIALLSDLAKTEHTSTERIEAILEEIHNVSRDASTSVRHITDAQTETPYFKLPDLMRQAADRIVIGIKHQIDFEGTEQIEHLRPQTRAQILLFFKECLVNVSRHAEASILKTNLKVTLKTVALTMEDNGHGIEGSEKNWIPPSLKRRAKLLGAKIKVESGRDKGTKIKLTFNRIQWTQFKKR